METCPKQNWAAGVCCSCHWCRCWKLDLRRRCSDCSHRRHKASGSDTTPSRKGSASGQCRQQRTKRMEVLQKAHSWRRSRPKPNAPTLRTRVARVDFCPATGPGCSVRWPVWLSNLEHGCSCSKQRQQLQVVCFRSCCSQKYSFACATVRLACGQAAAQNAHTKQMVIFGQPCRPAATTTTTLAAERRRRRLSNLCRPTRR